MTPLPVAKQDFSTLPARMKDLPISESGWIVPWFVAWKDGKPEFRAMDSVKFSRAIKERLCWVCGKTLGVYKCFVIGCMCGINRISSEPPSHLDCAVWSAQNCPFLSNPRMVRREDDEINNGNFQDRVAGHGITRNPGVTLLWVTRGFELIPDDKGKYVIQIGEPENVMFLCEGRTATREEIDHSVETGYPTLVNIALQQEGAIVELQRARARFEKLLPKV